MISYGKLCGYDAILYGDCDEGFRRGPKWGIFEADSGPYGTCDVDLRAPITLISHMELI